MMRLLIGSLTVDVAGGIIAANNKHPMIGTLGSGTAKMKGVAPHDLGVVKALVTFAGVGVVVVVGLLGEPEVDGVGTLHVAVALSDVLTEGTTGVLQVAVVAPLVGVTLRIRCQCAVPRQWLNPHLRPCLVVHLQELPCRALPPASAHH